jgi:hypothetical protein
MVLVLDEIPITDTMALSGVTEKDVRRRKPSCWLLSGFPAVGCCNPDPSGIGSACGGGSAGRWKMTDLMT